MNKVDEHTCRNYDYWSVVPFKPCYACICQLSKNSHERHRKTRNK